MNRRMFLRLSGAAALMPSVGFGIEPLKPLAVTRHVVDVGLERPFRILHVSDSHIARIDSRDGDALYAYARKRSRIGREMGEYYLDEAVAYARQRGLKIVHTGDLADFASVANLEYAERRFATDDFLPCVGNHEYWTAGANRAQETEDYKARTLPQVKRAFSAIPCRTVALGGLNFLVFDNAFDDVTEPVVTAFEDAVRQGLPIVLVCHVPFALTGVDNSLACGAPSSRSNVLTRAFVERVRREPLVKAILCGHVHCPETDRFSPTAMTYVAGANYLGDVSRIDFA